MYYSLSIHLLKDISFALYILADTNKTAIAIYVGEGNGTPLQYSCLENPMDRGAS